MRARGSLSWEEEVEPEIDISGALGHGDGVNGDFTLDFTGWPHNSKVVEQSNDWESVAVEEVDAGKCKETTLSFNFHLLPRSLPPNLLLDSSVV